MSIFSDALIKAMKTGEYFCPNCGKLMIFEYEDGDVLLCEHCGHSMYLDDYGLDEDEIWERDHPVNPLEEEKEFDETIELYDEVYNELDND